MARAAYMGDLRACTCALVLLALPLVGRDGLSSPLPPLPTTYDVSMEPAAWLILYSPGMPANPSRAATGSWYFDFPVGPEAAGVASVHYVTTRTNGAIANATNLRIEFAIDEHGSPTYQFRLKADNKCDPPANFSLFIQQQGDTLTAAEPYKRWWSAEMAPLKAGAGSMTVPLNKDGKWLSVFGERGDASSAAAAGFAMAKANLGALGLTFGGGCFRGHGVNLKPVAVTDPPTPQPTSRFILKLLRVW
jgi:hypothetical protein